MSNQIERNQTSGKTRQSRFQQNQRGSSAVSSRQRARRNGKKFLSLKKKTRRKIGYTVIEAGTGAKKVGWNETLSGEGTLWGLPRQNWNPPLEKEKKRGKSISKHWSNGRFRPH